MKDKLIKWIKNFLGLKDFNKIVLKKEVLVDILNLARSNYPKEFVALLKGKIENDELIIYQITMQKSFSSTKSAVIFSDNLPIKEDVIGSVHSHPSYSNRASKADLKFFNKTGMVHFIVSNPFRPENLAGYNMYGNRIKFEIR